MLWWWSHTLARPTVGVLPHVDTLPLTHLEQALAGVLSDLLASHGAAACSLSLRLLLWLLSGTPGSQTLLEWSGWGRGSSDLVALLSTAVGRSQLRQGRRAGCSGRQGKS